MERSIPMKTKLLIAAALLSLALPAAAESSSKQDAYEVSLSQIRLPRIENATIAFKECGECEFKTMRVSAETDYRLEGRSVSLKNFRAALEKVVDREKASVAIIYRLKDNRVTAISVYL
jgi:biopolymer transport protein ExbD